MGITLFVLLFSGGLVALLAVLLKTEKVQPPIFAAGIALLVVFDFALLSLDKIYFLHQAQDQIYLEKQHEYDQNIQRQLALYQQLTDIQLDATLQALALNNKQQTEDGVVQKVEWRNQLLEQMTALSFSEEKVTKVRKQINASVIAFLMENLNKEVRQSLGHRIYSEFVRSRPRNEWTDELFVNELEVYLNKQNLMSDSIQWAFTRLKEFKVSGVLISAEVVETNENKK